ncbi:hypothetical protein ACFX59_03850 [Sphingomonas sp. NCPPB 2930]|uniref:hypothetical protein n=1 Tax=Sphingomonas sp. NCPPB 2930 TaxID=3162788 RepID=UPI0036D928FA
MIAILLAAALASQSASKYDAPPIDPNKEGLLAIMREQPFWAGTSTKTPDELTLCVVSALWHHDMNAGAFPAGGSVYVKTQFTLARLSPRNGGGTDVTLWGGGGSKGGIVPRVRGCL